MLDNWDMLRPSVVWWRRVTEVALKGGRGACVCVCVVCGEHA